MEGLLEPREGGGGDVADGRDGDKVPELIDDERQGVPARGGVALDDRREAKHDGDHRLHVAEVVDQIQQVDADLLQVRLDQLGLHLSDAAVANEQVFPDVAGGESDLREMSCDIRDNSV